jgi:hypothetical protein
LDACRPDDLAELLDALFLQDRKLFRSSGNDGQIALFKLATRLGRGDRLAWCLNSEGFCPDLIFHLS